MNTNLPVLEFKEEQSGIFARCATIQIGEYKVSLSLSNEGYLEISSNVQRFWKAHVMMNHGKSKNLDKVFAISITDGGSR